MGNSQNIHIHVTKTKFGRQNPNAHIHMEVKLYPYHCAQVNFHLNLLSLECLH